MPHQSRSETGQYMKWRCDKDAEKGKYIQKHTKDKTGKSCENEDIRYW